MHDFIIKKEFPVSYETMWAVFADFAKSSNPSIKIELESEGKDGTNSPGAVRRIYIGTNVYREKLTDYIPGKSLTYQLLEGAPVADYFGTIQVDGDAQRSAVTWSVRFKPRFPVPAWMVEKNARKQIEAILDELYDVISRT